MGGNPLPEMKAEFNNQNEVQIESEYLRRMTMVARATVLDKKSMSDVDPLTRL